jgi:DNA-binding NtrC family response regulator
MNCPRLLCVDDDPGIREFYEALFGTHGYEVVLAGSGRQALDLFRTCKKPIAAVITDYDMPDLNGPELAAELKRSNPALPVIIVSGSRPVVEEAPHFVDAAFTKGAPIQEILDEIERLLAGVPPRPGLTSYLPLGEAVAAVAGVVLLFNRFLK